MSRIGTNRPRERAFSVFLLLLSLLALIAWIILIVRALNGGAGTDWLSIAGFGLSLSFAIGTFLLRETDKVAVPTDAADAAPLNRPASAVDAANAGFRVKPSPLADELTGLPARIWFNESLATELYRSSRYGHPLSLILLDVDHFSEVIGKNGQAAGDYLLMTVAKLLRSSVRRSDLIGRVGGDSFGVLAPETDLAGALKVGEKLRRAVELYPFDENLEVTVSVAVTGVTDSDDAASIIIRAEETVDIINQRGGNGVAKTPEIP